jgi:outer membrane receptor for ferric coprogen and ferric-rhodotorulic acid
MATNTISGTAMNMPLREVPMAINVITSEFLEDSLVEDAAYNLQGVLRTGTDNITRVPFTELSEDQSKGFMVNDPRQVVFSAKIDL